jgi:hypothetical protein
MFQRGRPRYYFQPGTYFFKAQPKFSRSLSLAQVAHPTGLPCTGKPDLNSRNFLIITTSLHIVNHSNAHRRKSRFRRFNSKSAVCGQISFDSTNQSDGNSAAKLELARNFETQKP